MSIENIENNRISSVFEYKGGAKQEYSNLEVILPTGELKYYFLNDDANQIATYIGTIISGISNSHGLHLSGLQPEQNPKLELKIKNDSILIDETYGIYVNENSHRFLCSSLITNSNTLKFDYHDTNNITDDSLEVCIDDNTIKCDTEKKEIYVNIPGLYNVAFDNRFFRINPPGTENSGMLTLNIGATNTLIYNQNISRNYC